MMFRVVVGRGPVGVPVRVALPFEVTSARPYGVMSNDVEYDIDCVEIADVAVKVIGYV